MARDATETVVACGKKCLSISAVSGLLACRELKILPGGSGSGIVSCAFVIAESGPIGVASGSISWCSSGHLIYFSKFKIIR